MKVTYLKLSNVAGLYVGSGIEEIEIDFSHSLNSIVAIVAPNASGKTCLLCSISPFANVTSIDDRSSLSYIREKKNGYKEIHYTDGDNVFIIKHYYKATGTSHTVKSYFMLNGTELNENGNVRSFLSLVEIHMGLTQDMMRLIRLGSNVSSIISLTPSARKDYIGKLIDEIDIYLQIYKDINDEKKVVKSLISTNDANLYNCHISDVLIEEDSLRMLEEEIKTLEKERDKMIAELASIESLMKTNDISDLKKKRSDAESSLGELHKVQDAITSSGLTNVSVDKLILNRSDAVSRKIDIQSKINSYRLSIDSSLRNIERLETSVKKITSNNDVKSLTDMISSLRKSIESTNPIIASFKPPVGVTSESLNDIIGKLSSFNVIGQTIRSFGSKPFDVYTQLVREKKSVDKWLKDQANKIKSGIKEADIRSLFELMFKDDDIISPNCDYEFMECPFYRFAEVLDNTQKELDKSYDSETLRYIQIISNNIDIMLNEIDRFRSIRIPDRLRGLLSESSMIERFSDKLPFFDVDAFQEYLTIVNAYEVYRNDVDNLAKYEYQLSIYRNSGIDGQLAEIKQLNDNISFYRNNIDTLSNQLENIDSELAAIDSKISLVSRFNEISKYKDMFESTIMSTTKILEPLERAEQERIRVDIELRQKSSQIESTREQHKRLERRIHEYRRLVEEGEALSKKNKHLQIIMETVNTKEGIPVIYMKKYLGRIKDLANNLLRIVYGDSFKLAKFHITHDTFDIPYIKNGIKVADVKYSSQSELAMSTVAISFALSNRSSGKYNIPLLDEVESGLDESNRASFLKLFNMQMNALNAEQAFVISQNLSQMANVPMDVIQLGDAGIQPSKIHNIIYSRRG